MPPVESPIHTLLKAGRAYRNRKPWHLGYRRLGLLIILATALVSAGFFAWLAGF